MASPLLDVKHMSRKWQVTVLERLMSKILTQIGFIFPRLCYLTHRFLLKKGEFGNVIQDNCGNVVQMIHW